VILGYPEATASGERDPNGIRINGRILMATARAEAPRQLRHRVLSLVFFAAFALGIEHFFGWSTLLAPWADLGPDAIAGVLALLAVTYLARGLRLYRFYRSRLGFLASQKLLLQHNLWTVLLPARAGEIAFPVLMQRYFDIPARQSLPVLLWFRVLDVHALLLVVGFALLLPRGAPVSAAFAAAWIWILVAALYCRPLQIVMLKRLPGRLAAKCLDVIATRPFPMGRLLESWLWTMICWTVKLLLFA